ncbi:hypothetical protein [Aliarcobacter vitoriensis]|uniref:Uncharacterized protein n=1 Tax=Aliarcobacter vitoriensis TaxID=2011099 RepID=A0A366MSD4_9BACT|nr:hypothetical protein [Aliarcobacter vitoriensis]RBQ28409.1 hypothetical protein CRU91_09315 [Aliarcobacter vitoriensis]
MELKQRLEVRAKAGVSNPAEVTNDALDLALKEAFEIVGKKQVSDTTKLDIAFFRLMIMIKKSGASEDDMELYKAALQIVKNANSLESTGEEIPANFVKVKQRGNSWQ